ARTKPSHIREAPRTDFCSIAASTVRVSETSERPDPVCTPTKEPQHRPRRVVLRPSDTRHGWQRSSARGQMQKLPSVGKFHFELPFLVFYSITSSARASSVGASSSRRPTIGSGYGDGLACASERPRSAARKSKLMAANDKTAPPAS